MERCRIRWPALLLVIAACAGCAPQATAAIALPPGLPTAALFDCADATVHDLHGDDEQWNLRVTRRDRVGGRFETGHFDDSNVMGYRVRLVRAGAAPRASLSVRAAGAYFTDLGATEALSRFQARLTRCLARAAH